MKKTKNEGEKYDLIVSQFDNDRVKSLREKKYIDIFIKDLPSNSHILDVGCGMAEPIAKYLSENSFRVTGIDSSKEMIKLARNRLPKMKWFYGDMRDIKLDEKYDGLIAYDSFFHLTINDQIKMMERFAIWLKLNGKLMITTGPDESEIIDAPMHGQHFSYYSMSRDDYRKYFKLNNFEVLLCEEDQPQHLIWIAKKIFNECG